MTPSRLRLLRLVETAIMIGLAVALSEIKLFKMPYGGSVTAGSMIPILLVALRHGPVWGITAGVLAGMANYLLEPWFVHPIQVILDYPLAFGALGLAGFASGKSERVAAWMGSLAITARMLMHVIAGVVFFAENAPEGYSPLLYSILYNGAYMVPELIISGVMLMFLLPALRRALPTGIQAQHG